MRARTTAAWPTMRRLRAQWHLQLPLHAGRITPSSPLPLPWRPAAGVLALPYALGTLGWIAGPFCILAFFFVSYWASMVRACVCVRGGGMPPRVRLPA